MTGMCSPWIAGSDIINLRGRDATAAIDDAVLDSSALAASEILYVLSGRQFPGPCRVTLRPATMPAGSAYGDWVRLYGLMVGNVWLGAGVGYWGWGTCRGGSHSECPDRREIDLGVYPITAINAVVENGVTLNPSAYRVDNDRLLVRVDGNNWNWCQDVNLPAGSAGTWSVDVSYGDQLPETARAAAVSLAMEMGKATMGLASLLPQRVTQVNRQQVSWVLLDPMQFFKEGKTGVYDVDLFIATYNPTGMRSRSRVLSPDTMSRTRRGPITGGTP